MFIFERVCSVLTAVIIKCQCPTLSNYTEKGRDNRRSHFSAYFHVYCVATKRRTRTSARTVQNFTASHASSSGSATGTENAPTAPIFWTSMDWSTAPN